MLQYYLVAIFTLTSVLVIYVIVLDLVLTIEVSWLQIHVFQALRCVHSDTVVCLVNREKGKKEKEGFGFNNVAFQWPVITWYEAQN